MAAQIYKLIDKYHFEGNGNWLRRRFLLIWFLCISLMFFVIIDVFCDIICPRILIDQWHLKA